MVLLALVMWIHLMAVIAFVGGTLLYIAAYRPAMILLKPRPEQMAFAARFEQSARTIRWLSLVLLLATGFFSLLYEGGSARIESTYGTILMLKLLLALILFALTAIHDFVIAPPTLARSHDRSASAQSVEVPPGQFWLGLGVLGLSVLIVFVAVVLVRL